MHERSTLRGRCWDGKTMMAWQYDDGGRAGAGFQGRAGDCVTRAIAIATGKPYSEVYDALNALIKKHERQRPGRKPSSARNGVRKAIHKRYLESLGWQWHPTMHVGSGCKVHMCEEELPKGTLIVQVSRHLTCVKDHVIHDTHDPSRPGIACEDGVQRITRRCVYGYWTPPPLNRA